MKGVGQQEVVAALRTVASGGFVTSAAVAARLRSTFLAGDEVRPAPLPQLSDREREVVTLVGQGLANPAISDRLYLSPKTVRNLVSSAMGKLGSPTARRWPSQRATPAWWGDRRAGRSVCARRRPPRPTAAAAG